MKRFLLSVCALLIFAVAPASAKKEKAVTFDTYGYEGTISKDGCLNCGNWDDAIQEFAAAEYKAWKGGDKKAYQKMQDKTRAGCRAQEAQLAAYQSALANEDYLAAAGLTPYGWVEVSMYASEAKMTLNAIKDTRDDNEDILKVAAAYFLKAQNLKDNLGELCATASNPVGKIKKRLAVYQSRIDKGLLFIARCRGEKPWPEQD